MHGFTSSGSRIGFALLTAGTQLAPALAAGEATAVVTDFGNRMLQVLNDPLSPAERQKRLGALLDQDFDFVMIGRFVLGRYWQSATDQEKREFAPLFRDYVAQNYSGLFNEFTGASLTGVSFKVTGERPEGPGTTIVNATVMQRDNSPPAKVDGRVSMDTGSAKITDVITEDISMSLTYRQEFASVIERSGGVSGLIAQLRTKTNIATQ